MVLVDTSVLIDYLRGTQNSQVRIFQSILDSSLPFGLSSIVYQEILQGAKTELDFDLLKRYLDTQKIYYLRDNRESYAMAAKIYRALRGKGMTCGTIDCLIAQCAIENDLFLLHNDEDFERIRKVSDLKIFVNL